MWSRFANLPLFACGCGQLGCLETYISGTGLGNLYQHLVKSNAGVNKAGPEIIDDWQQGELHATQAVAMYLDILASSLAGLMTQFNPDIIVLGGGLSEQPWLYKEVTQRIPSYLMHNMTACPVVAAHFGGAGGVRGAALLTKCST
nr:ROK family protein [Oceanisphaera avium]